MNDTPHDVKPRRRCRIGIHDWFHRTLRVGGSLSSWDECWWCKKVRNDQRVRVD